MRERFLPALIMLLAGAVTSVLNIINKVERVTALKRLLIVLLIFYIIGSITKAVIRKATMQKPKTNEEEMLEENVETQQENISQ